MESNDSQCVVEPILGSRVVEARGVSSVLVAKRSASGHQFVYKFG